MVADPFDGFILMVCVAAKNYGTILRISNTGGKEAESQFMVRTLQGKKMNQIQ